MAVAVPFGIAMAVVAVVVVVVPVVDVHRDVARAGFRPQREPGRQIQVQQQRRAEGDRRDVALDPAPVVLPLVGSGLRAEPEPDAEQAVRLPDRQAHVAERRDVVLPAVGVERDAAEARFDAEQGPPGRGGPDGRRGRGGFLRGGRQREREEQGGENRSFHGRGSFRKRNVAEPGPRVNRDAGPVRRRGMARPARGRCRRPGRCGRMLRMDGQAFQGKILDAASMRAERDRLHAEGKTLVFTNGCFDILHAGHVTYLQFARAQGDALCLGLNSDASVRRNKGPKRPIVSEDNRAKLLACLRFVDYVVLFDEDEPKALIAKILPDVLVKGRDWAHYVSGRDVVEANGGRVVLADMVPGLSTTNVIERILAAYREP
ncbi:MAG: D-glycero-beta-D-manno-heptose 1-phosphate adenylyltransferase [Kiritimatiellae bacterium]|nr:D-glycero-beta-D-manno-heptose 1-phosphate adenylyltransferase [Kiritimatiellia bacterium]